MMIYDDHGKYTGIDREVCPFGIWQSLVAAWVTAGMCISKFIVKAMLIKKGTIGSSTIWWANLGYDKEGKKLQ